MKKAKKFNKKRILKSVFATCVILLILIVCVSAGIMEMNKWSHHTVTHLETNQRVKNISTSTKLLGNKKVNGKYTIYFYMDNCPHCEHMIPRVYVHNRLTPSQWFHAHGIQYRDLLNGHNTNNVQLSQTAHISQVPEKATITFHDGNIIHVHKTSNLY